MTILRFTPATGTGSIDAASSWSPQQVPGQGDTAIVTTGTLAASNEQLTGVSLFAFSSAAATAPTLALTGVTIGSSSSLIVDSASGYPITLQLASSFENDGRVEFGGPLTVQASSGASVVNKGVVVLRAAAASIGGSIENDGTVSLRDTSAATIGTSLTGTGTVLIGPGADVEFTGSVSSGQTVVLQGGTAADTTIQIDSPSASGAAISGFVAGDTLKLQTFYGTPTSAVYTSTGTDTGTLVVASRYVSVSIKLDGAYAATDFSAVTSGSGIAITTTNTTAGVDDSSAVYRFFDTTDGTHFYTSSATERDTIVDTRSDLTYEGVGLTAADPNGSASEPVFRFFDSVHGTHFYTASSAERDSVLATRSDLVFEGTGFYGHAAQQQGDSAVFRFFDTQNGTHFYTESSTEAATVKSTRADLTYEGVAFYAPS